MNAEGKPTRSENLAVAAAGEYAGQLRRFLLRRLRERPQDVEDLAQQVYVRLLGLAKDGSLVRQPSAYLFRVASSVLSDFYTAERKQGHVLYDSDVFMQAADHQAGPDALAALELQQELEEALAQLPPTQKAVLLMQERDGYQYKEIALNLRLSVDTVHKYVTVAKAKLRTLLWRHNIGETHDTKRAPGSRFGRLYAQRASSPSDVGNATVKL
jgi:RNA polymerase sigma factor (sigma-70 family)